VNVDKYLICRLSESHYQSQKTFTSLVGLFQY